MLVLFDLDGTLVRTRGAGMEAMYETARELFGFDFRHATTRVEGNIDPLIFHGLCRENGIDEPERHHARFRTEYERRLRTKLEERGRAQALPGTLELVAALERDPRFTLGVLTGNYPETGKLKMVAAGFALERFPVAAWGDDAAARPGLVPVAHARHRARGGAELAPAQLIVIGDTPWDVECAQLNGARCLAVATGRFGCAELCESGAEQAFEDLSDLGAVLSVLERGSS